MLCECVMKCVVYLMTVHVDRMVLVWAVDYGLSTELDVSV